MSDRRVHNAFRLAKRGFQGQRASESMRRALDQLRRAQQPWPRATAPERVDPKKEEQPRA
ncbi:MAG: hypothetical protein IT460_15310 [Planctomycetes bacterium]|nr:hypothetical protein [Planctomycetota bacterium]